MKQLKITKLFHWLYALLMLAPCFAILFKCLYVVFNKNAKDSYYGETINEEVLVYKNINQLQSYQNYHFNNNGFTAISGQSTNVYTTITVDNLVSTDMNRDLSQSKYLLFYLSSYGNPRIKFNDIDNHEIAQYSLVDEVVIFTFDFISLTSVQNNTWLSDFDVFSYTEYNRFSFLDNVFYYSLDEVATSDIFGWARYSFIAQPFSYITGLFGMSADNPLNIYFSYWASISIIWLVFDIVLYVPLLAHKWLDEGGI